LAAIGVTSERSKSTWILSSETMVTNASRMKLATMLVPMILRLPLKTVGRLFFGTKVDRKVRHGDQDDRRQNLLPMLKESSDLDRVRPNPAHERAEDETHDHRTENEPEILSRRGIQLNKPCRWVHY
jgi:hypothetical protein